MLYDGNKFLRILRQAIQAGEAERDLEARIRDLHSQIDSLAIGDNRRQELFGDIYRLSEERCKAMRARDDCAQIARACREWIAASGARPRYDFPAPQPAADIEQAYDDLERIAAEQCKLINKRREILKTIDSEMRSLAIREEKIITELEAAGEIATRLPSSDPAIILSAK